MDNKNVAVIYIIGQSASGKSTLGRLISAKIRAALVPLDSLCNRLEPNRWVNLSHLECEAVVARILKKQRVVVEGKYSFRELFKAADLIIWLKVPGWLSLLRHLKRGLYSQDLKYRFSLSDHLILFVKIFRQSYLPEESREFDNFRYYHHDKIEKMLNNYQDKLLKIDHKYKPEGLLEHVSLLALAADKNRPFRPCARPNDPPVKKKTRQRPTEMRPGYSSGTGLQA